MINNTTISPTRRQRQSRRRQIAPQFHVGQRLVIQKYPWPTPRTRMVEIEDIRELDHSAINPNTPPSYLYCLRGENGSFTVVTYGELRRRVVEVL